jgi:hypothetical protein
VDTTKYYGNLVAIIDLIPFGFDGYPGVVDFTIPLNGVTGTDGNETLLLSKEAPYP